MIPALKFPFSFDQDRLNQELEFLEGDTEWHTHPDYTVADHGDWTAVALLSPTGDHEAVQSLKYSGQVPQKTFLLSKCTYMDEVISKFETEVHRARLMKLEAGRVIREHRDTGHQRYSYTRGFLRVHIPIRTNEKVAWRLRGDKIDMQPGDVWYVNVCQPHSVENRGEVDRVHLFLDLKVNDWVKGFFPRESIFDKTQVFF